MIPDLLAIGLGWIVAAMILRLAWRRLAQ